MVEAGQVIVCICILITFVVCALRFYLRVIVARQFILMEFSLIVALVMEIIFGSLQLKIFGLLAAPPSPENGVLLNKLFFVGTFPYFVSLWSVKISINLLHLRLTQRLPQVHIWAKRSIFILIAGFMLIMITYPFGCWPTYRKWEGGMGGVEACPPITREWDFWTHLAIHLTTDIYLCILPFPALIQIGERRLRIAICGVYTLAVVAIIVSAVRAALLGLNPQSNIKYIMSLTIIEVATCIVVGCLPCISSTFTRKYVYNSKNMSAANRGSTAAFNSTGRSSTFKQQEVSHMESIDLSTAKDGVIETSYLSQCSYGVEGAEPVVHPEHIRETTTVRVMVS